MRQTAITLGILVLLGLIALGFDITASKKSEQLAMTASYATTTLLIKDAEVIFEIADTPTEQGIGLGGRKELSEGAGMLFIFEQAGNYGIWMKDMLIPIDIGWLDEDLCLVTTIKNLSPDTYPMIYKPAVAARYVAELPARFFESHNIVEGDCFEPTTL